MAIYLTPREVADRWRCSARQVRRLCASGELVAMRLGLESWRIAVAAVEAYERANTRAGHADEAPKPEAPRRKEVAVAGLDGFELPPDYEPVFGHLWPGHVPAKRKRLSAATKNR